MFSVGKDFSFRHKVGVFSRKSANYFAIRDVACCTVQRGMLSLFGVSGYYEAVELKCVYQVVDGGVEAGFCFGAGADDFAVCEDEEYGFGVFHSID